MSGQPVAAAQIIIAVVPIVGIVMAGVLIFFYLFWRNKQIICQIQTKTYTPIKFNLSGFCLISGILLLMIGGVLTVLFSIIDGVSCGIGLLLYYFISSKAGKEKLKDD